MQTFRIKLDDNSLSDHAFSSFGLTDPKEADEMRKTDDEDRSSFVKEFVWFIIKIASVLGKLAMLILIGIGFMIFRAFRIGNKAEGGILSFF